ncbi:MAG: hypothetical protein GY946_28780, partial [bacterium]|nr:hypothetical protein [bacterium]
SFEGLDPKTIDTTAVVMVRYEWAVRPGDLVPVIFRSEAAPHGIWVPDAAIVALNDAHTIYSVTDGVAKALEVTVHESVGRMRRVEGAGVTDGITIVMIGSQYLFDGAKVSVTREIDLEGWIRRTQ